MSKTSYHISLKGYVGGYDFDRSDVDAVLAANEDKQVNVLIDSTGGSLATGLSISAAFRNHGNVHVHFVSLNASAATIASIGAKHISIDTGAMYMVHKCSMSFFQWGSLNSDEFSSLIADCEKIKADLDKLDLNIARIYAARCKRKPEDLLALMKEGAWLTAQEALEWGFVDEITDYADEPAATLSDSLASAMACAGMPIPNLRPEAAPEGLFSKFLAALSSFFKMSSKPIASVMNKTYSLICAVLGLSAIEMTDSKAALSAEQLDLLENHIADLGKKLKDSEAKVADLQAKLDKKPAEESHQVVENSKPEVQEPKNEVEQFVDTYNSAHALFDEV